MSRQQILCFATVVLVCASSAFADVLILKTGGRVEGNVLNVDPPTTDNFYLVETKSGGTLKLAKSHVERLMRKTPLERKYDEYVLKMPKTVDGNWKMAEWCRENKLLHHREVHLEEIIKLDPDHEEARLGLGYSTVDDRWVKMDEYNLAHGYVRYKGAWKPRQEVALAELKERQIKAEGDWRKKVKMWRGWYGKRRHQEGMAELRQINDPLAAVALSETLEDEPFNDMKLLYIEVLGKLPSGTGELALTKVAIEDDQPAVREAALTQLQKIGSRMAISNFVRSLDPKQQKENHKINRAGIALSWMKDEDTINALIDALITEHKYKTGAGGGSPIGASFGNGGSGLNTGSKPKLILRKHQNDGVLLALREITGEDFRYDQEAWRNWHADENTPADVNLRRSD